MGRIEFGTFQKRSRVAELQVSHRRIWVQVCRNAQTNLNRLDPSLGATYKAHLQHTAEQDIRFVSPGTYPAGAWRRGRGGR